MFFLDFLCKKSIFSFFITFLLNLSYLKELNVKLKEECFEWLESGEIEKLADLEEVIRSILDAKIVSYKDFETIGKGKQKKRGVFKKKIFLYVVE